MWNTAEPSAYFSYSQPLGYFNQFPVQQNYDLGLDTTNTNAVRNFQHCLQEDNCFNYNHYHNQPQPVMSQPIQPPLLTQNSLSSDQNDLKAYITAVNEAMGSSASGEVVTVPSDGSSSLDDWILSVVYGPEHSENILAQDVNQCPEDVNTINTPESNMGQKPDIKSVYKCDPCNKTFTAKCYLTQHNNSIHSKLKLFRCHICGKRYANADALNKHLTRHSGDKPQKCPLCYKSFNHTSDLKRHMHEHFGSKPYTCEICGKGFVRNDHMLKHMETHYKRAARNRPSNSTITS